jgi:hypothetical protein
MAFPLIGFPQLSPLAFVTFAFYGAAANVAESWLADKPAGRAECLETGGPMQVQAIGPHM